MATKKYLVTGVFRQKHKDCMAECQSCDSYDEAVALMYEWRKERKYKEVYIEPIE